MVDIIYVTNIDDAIKAITEGFEPVECSFGRESAVGKHVLDHHGKYSGEDAVSVKAALLALQDVRLSKFVVTGTPDCDQIYAIAALGGLLNPIIMEEAKAIAEIDIDPIGRDLTDSRYIKILMFNQATQGRKNSIESTQNALEELVRIYTRKLSTSDMDLAVKKEYERREKVMGDIQEREEGRVALVRSNAWGYDVWYQIAPIVVLYNDTKKTVTLGLCPKTGGNLCDKSGFDLLGPEGLKTLIPILDQRIMPGFGGRETIIGSPRGVDMDYQHAIEAYQIVKEALTSRTL